MRKSVSRAATPFVLASALALLFALVSIGPAAATDFSVTTAADSGAGSLRQAVTDANLNTGPDRILFAPVVAGTIGVTSGQLSITGDTEVIGPGADVLRVSADQKSRVLAIGPGATVTISGLEIADGRIAAANGGGGSATGGSGGAGGVAITPGSTGTAGTAGGASGSSGGGGSPVGGAGIRNEGDLTLSQVAITHSFATGGDALDVAATGGAGGPGGAAVGANSTGGKGGVGGAANTVFGQAPGVQGAGIYNSGELTIRSSTVSGNVASGGNGGNATATAGSGGTGGNGNAEGSAGGAGGKGGAALAEAGAGGDALGAGIYNQGTLSIANSTISGNVAEVGSAGTGKEIAGAAGPNGSGSEGAKGGPGGQPGTATAIAGAAGAGSGGAVFNAVGGSATIENSTLAGNGAALAANLSASAPIGVRSTIVSDPVGAGNCSGEVSSLGFNLDSGGSCNFGQASDLAGADPRLGLLGEHGGATETLLPAVDSPAIDHGVRNGYATDQRGEARTNDSLGIANAAAGGDGTDVGAVELPAQPFVPPVSSPPAPPPPTTKPTPALCDGRRATIEGSAKADRIKGTAKADVIAGLGGGDRISGLAGNDRICGGAGKDTLAGGAGTDLLSGGAGADQLLGGPGKDVLSGGAGKDTQKQ